MHAEEKIMNLLYKGKTKDVYALENGNVLLKFKDDLEILHGATFVAVMSGHLLAFDDPARPLTAAD